MARIRGLVDYGHGIPTNPGAPRSIDVSDHAVRPAEKPARRAFAPIKRQYRPRPSPEQVYAYLLKIAKAGARAPQHDILERDFGTSAINIVLELAHAGRIRIEVWAKNWRVIEIEGFRTMAPPHIHEGAQPYRVIHGVRP